MTPPKPCPFCGHIGVRFSDGETIRWGQLSCAGCDVTLEVSRKYPPGDEWHERAIEEWNRWENEKPPSLTKEQIRQLANEAYKALGAVKVLGNGGYTHDSYDVWESAWAKGFEAACRMYSMVETEK